MNPPDFIRQYVQRFAVIREEEALDIAGHLQRKEYPKNEWILRAGEIEHYLYFIEKGLVRRFFERNGEDITDNFFFDGNPGCAYASFVTQKPSRENMIAMENTVIWRMHHRDFEALCDKYRSFEHFTRLVGQWLYVLNHERVCSFLYDTPEERYEKLLKERPRIFERVPLYHVATYLGITRETLSRIRSKRK